MTTRMRNDEEVLALSYKTIPQVIEILQEKLELYGDKATVEVGYDYNYGDYEGEFSIRYQRPWTDEELRLEARDKERRLKIDRAEWERLAKKYGVVTDAKTSND